MIKDTFLDTLISVPLLSHASVSGDGWGLISKLNFCASFVWDDINTTSIVNN